MKGSKYILSATLFVLVFAAGLITVEKRTGFISYLDGLFISEGMQKKLCRNDEKMRRDYIERKIFRGLKPMETPLVVDAVCIDNGTIDKYRKMDIGLKRVRYLKRGEIWFEVLYDAEDTLLDWNGCYD